jgi:hypothetical protein
VDDYYFESETTETETTFDGEQRVEPSDERSEAIRNRAKLGAPHLDDEPLVIDNESAVRVGGEELTHRSCAGPLRRRQRPCRSRRRESRAHREHP